MTQYLSTLTLEALDALTLDELSNLELSELSVFPVEAFVVTAGNEYICTVVNATPEAPVTVSIISAYYVESWS